MRTNKYPGDITDEQWNLIERLIPVYPGGRPRKTDLRDVVDAIFYLLRTGCQWRYLPKDLPAKSTVCQKTQDDQDKCSCSYHSKQNELRTNNSVTGEKHGMRGEETRKARCR